MKQTFMVFPCEFPLKIIGKAGTQFLMEISALIQKYFPNTPASGITTKLSEHGKYQSITAVVHALDQATLDALYQELTRHPDIQMVL